MTHTTQPTPNSGPELTTPSITTTLRAADVEGEPFSAGHARRAVALLARSAHRTGARSLAAIQGAVRAVFRRAQRVDADLEVVAAAVVKGASDAAPDLDLPSGEAGAAAGLTAVQAARRRSLGRIEAIQTAAAKALARFRPDRSRTRRQRVLLDVTQAAPRYRRAGTRLLRLRASGPAARAARTAEGYLRIAVRHGWAPRRAIVGTAQACVARSVHEGTDPGRNAAALVAVSAAAAEGLGISAQLAATTAATAALDAAARVSDHALLAVRERITEPAALVAG